MLLILLSVYKIYNFFTLIALEVFRLLKNIHQASFCNALCLLCQIALE